MTMWRAVRFAQISETLALYSDFELGSLVATARDGAVGVGGDCGVVDVRGVPVFVKRIPLTDRELEHPHSTANLFDLPMFCQYGIGGPGFNAWRELAANLTITDLVLSGETASFPLLYQWRVLPGRAEAAAEHLDIEAAVAALDDNPSVRTRLEALADASSSLVLFSEYLPLALRPWLDEDSAEKAELVERQLCEIVAALISCELLHMDGHIENMRTDGERIYLTDFGLATSPRFDLSVEERAFVARNVTHDAGYAAMRLVNWLVNAVCGVPELAGVPPVARNAYVLGCAVGEIPDDVPPVVAAILARHAPTAARMNRFYWGLFGGDIHATYPAGDP